MDFLKQPYPYYHRGTELIKIAFLILVVGFLFEMLIVPFPRTPSEHEFPYWIITLFHIGVASFTYAIYFLIIGLFVNDDDWKVSKELFAVFGLLLLIGVGEWAIRPIIYSNKNLWLKYLIEEVWHAYLSGGLIYLLVTLVNVNFLSRKHTIESSRLSFSRDMMSTKQLDIKTQNLSDDFSLNPSDFICARAEGNYLQVYLMSDSNNIVSLKRITLQSLCDQLGDFEFIVKTHRGYVVNMNYISGVEGNAQGYQLSIDALDFNVPVSRKYLEHFKRKVRR